MLISSPEKVANYIKSIPKGKSKTLKEMRLDLAIQEGADSSCPVTTGIFLRQAIEKHGSQIPYWRVIDDCHPVVKKLNLNPERIKKLRVLEGLA